MTAKVRLTVGIAGGTGSGKTTLSATIAENIGSANAALIGLDAYYRDHSHIPLEERASINYDHPDEIEVELLLEHLRTLKKGCTINIPVYSYDTHTRSTETVRIEPTPIVIVEGLFVLWDDELRSELDLKIFIECDSDVRFIRRLRRDTEERGRTIESVLTQYLETVRPMHKTFVAPSRIHADIVVSDLEDNKNVLIPVVDRIREILTTQYESNAHEL